MLNKYKNDLLRILKESQVDISEINKREDKIDGHPATIIEVKNSRLYFVIRNAKDDHNLFDCKYTTFSPNYREQGYFPDKGHIDFEEVKKLYNNWLNAHVKEYLLEKSSKDLWELLTSNKEVLALNNYNFNNRDYFIDNEKRQIKEAIYKVKFTIEANLKLTDEEFQKIDARLTYLSDGVDRLNKFDWKGLLLATIISIAITLSLDTGKGKQLYVMFKQVFEAMKPLLDI